MASETGLSPHTVKSWWRERAGELGVALSLEARVLHREDSPYQTIEILEHDDFGRVLVLDGYVQACQADEFIYHEMAVHVPLLGRERRDSSVLIIGGGDGGMAREVLRHRDIAHVTMIEIDAGVVEFSKQYLPSLSAGAFDDPRLTLVIADGAAFVREATDRFDVVISDSTDPIGPGEVLFTDSFYGHVKRLLAPGGIFVTQNGVPFMQGGELAGTMRAFRSLFGDATCYLAT
ncbi:MAG: polyamine aminopropyltransferase, partial [Proteobacteria bacterium]|nr:polyamine aminopropyltransferase [Pseudomonadota bacterium]